MAVAVAAAIWRSFMSLNFHLAMGANPPWLISPDPNDQGVDLDSLMVVMQLVLVGASVRYLVSIRRAHREDAPACRLTVRTMLSSYPKEEGAMLATRLSRRTMLKAGAIAGAGLAVPWRWLAVPRRPQAFSQSDKLRKFIQPLRNPVLGGIPLAAADTTPQPWWQPGVTHYTIDIGQFTDQLHPDLPNPTRLWGFGQGGNFRHLGGIIAAKRGRRSRSRSATTCRRRTSCRSTGRSWAPRTRTTGRTSTCTAASSRGPATAARSPGGTRTATRARASSTTQCSACPSPAANEAEYYYPNDQGARLVWYHDHSVGTTRLNAYCGHRLRLRDLRRLRARARRAESPARPARPANGLPRLPGQDLRPHGTSRRCDPTWAGLPHSRPGDLWYAHVYDPDRWDLGPTPAGPPPDPSCVPEFFGDTMLVNGTVYPFLEVEQRQYRFRLLNACQARFLNPRLVYATGPDQHRARRPRPARRSSRSGPRAASCRHPSTSAARGPLRSGDPTPSQLLLAPAERADLIVDFRDVPAGPG